MNINSASSLEGIVLAVVPHLFRQRANSGFQASTGVNAAMPGEAQRRELGFFFSKVLRRFQGGKPPVVEKRVAPGSGIKANPGERFILHRGIGESAVRHGQRVGFRGGTPYRILKASQSVRVRFNQALDHADRLGPRPR